MNTIIKFKYKNGIFLLLFAMILGIIIAGYVSCGKPETKPKPENPKDYREKWVGTYECDKEKGTAKKVIIDVKLTGDSLLSIIESDLPEGYHPSVKHNVKVSCVGDFSDSKDDVSGNFYTDSLFLRLYYYISNTLYTCEYKGKKIKI